MICIQFSKQTTKSKLKHWLLTIHCFWYCVRYLCCYNWIFLHFKMKLAIRSELILTTSYIGNTYNKRPSYSAIHVSRHIASSLLGSLHFKTQAYSCVQKERLLTLLPLRFSFPIVLSVVQTASPESCLSFQFLRFVQSSLKRPCKRFDDY